MGYIFEQECCPSLLRQYQHDNRFTIGGLGSATLQVVQKHYLSTKGYAIPHSASSQRALDSVIYLSEPSGPWVTLRYYGRGALVEAKREAREKREFMECFIRDCETFKIFDGIVEFDASFQNDVSYWMFLNIKLNFKGETVSYFKPHDISGGCRLGVSVQALVGTMPLHRPKDRLCRG